MNFDPQKTLFIIDGSSFLYRSYYSMRPLHTAAGIPVQAVYNFCRMIKKLIKQFEPQHMIIAWDSPGKTTRHEVYEEYKAGRDAAPSDLHQQKEKIIEFGQLIGITQVAKPGVEADDLMYSLARDWTEKDGVAVFVTSDKDMGQAINANTFMFDPFKDITYDLPAFEEKMGFPVDRLPLYFALLGDASDNIPGVRGIGKKGATQLAQQFETVEQLYDNIEDVTPARAKTALEENRDNAFLSRDLFLLRYYKTGITPERSTFSTDNWSQAAPLFRELEFKSLLKEIDPNTTAFSEPSTEEKREALKKYTFHTITTHEQLATLCTALEKCDAFAIDTETNGLRALEVDLVGISICMKEGVAYYIPCAHKTEEEQLKCDEIVHALAPIMRNPAIKKYLHNAKYDIHVLHAHGLELQGLGFDSMIAANLLKKDWQRVSLKYLSYQYFNEYMLTYKEVVATCGAADFSYVPIEIATEYSAFDAHQTWRLTQLLMPRIEQEEMTFAYYSIELPLVYALTHMEQKGILLDTSVLDTLRTPIAQELKRLEEEILTFVPEDLLPINLNSSRQVGYLLFNVLELPRQKKSAKGTHYSTDQEVLGILSKLHPVPDLILKYRELYKLKSTYVDALPEYVNPKTGRIHTSFSQIIVATGRLSSSDPNLQNIPVGGASGFGGQVRAAFKPAPDHIFISADYSQIELRVLAHLSKDENLVNAFLEGKDIHAETASRLFDVSLADVSNQQRQIGKRINFSILYGLTPYGLSKDLGIPLSDARTYIERYFEQYPGVSAWMESVVENTKKHGYTQTLWGRRRYVPAIHEKNKVLFEEARRIAVNTVAQGTAAEIVKQGMICLDQEIMQKGIEAYPLLQIHDEMLISAHRLCAAKAEEITIECLERVVDWDIPLVVTVRQGANWREASK